MRSRNIAAFVKNGPKQNSELERPEQRSKSQEQRLEIGQAGTPDRRIERLDGEQMKLSWSS
jgi:hypothetical protein